MEEAEENLRELDERSVHEKIPDSYIKEVFEVMVRAGWPTYQILTKRSERLLELAPELPWPAHVWMGVSIENSNYVQMAPTAIAARSALKCAGSSRMPEPDLLELFVAPLEAIGVRDLAARLRRLGRNPAERPTLRGKNRTLLSPGLSRMHDRGSRIAPRISKPLL